MNDLAIDPNCVPDDRLADFFWLVGWLEGEGCFSFSNSPVVAGTSTDEDTIRRVSGILGVSRYAKPPKRKNWKQQYSCGVYGDTAIDWMKAVLPYMSERRSGRISQLLLRCHNRPGKAVGSRNHMAKLRECDIPRILKLHESGTSRADIALEFGVARNTIKSVVTRKAWKHVV